MAATVRAAGRSNQVEVRDTIFALSSGAPPAAIGVIRVSGPQAAAALGALTGRLPPPRYAALRTLRGRDGAVLDRALVLYFPGPANSTGEDLAELHVHGGRAVVDAVLGALGNIDGLRPAQPGEFTRRAFENGRIDLAEAEGLSDLLRAETEAQLRNALALAGGALSRTVEAWQARLLVLSARAEAVLDFSDEGEVGEADAVLATDIQALAAEIEAALAQPSAERLRDGVRVALAGPPNSGKSTLLNALVQREAALVSPIPGTTRDVIEAPVAIGGLPFLFSDLAGLRGETDDVIERMGIDRARQVAAAADIILWLGDDPPPEGLGDVIGVHARCDLPGREQKRPSADVAVSAVTGTGVRELVALIEARARLLLPGEGEVALSRRQRDLLGLAAQRLREVGASSDPLLTAEDLRSARGALDRLTGRAGPEEMLDALFGTFCIGK